MAELDSGSVNFQGRTDRIHHSALLQQFAEKNSENLKNFQSLPPAQQLELITEFKNAAGVKDPQAKITSREPADLSDISSPPDTHIRSYSLTDAKGKRLATVGFAANGRAISSISSEIEGERAFEEKLLGVATQVLNSNKANLENYLGTAKAKEYFGEIRRGQPPKLNFEGLAEFKAIVPYTVYRTKNDELALHVRLYNGGNSGEANFVITQNGVDGQFRAYSESPKSNLKLTDFPLLFRKGLSVAVENNENSIAADKDRNGEVTLTEIVERKSARGIFNGSGLGMDPEAATSNRENAQALFNELPAKLQAEALLDLKRGPVNFSMSQIPNDKILGLALALQDLEEGELIKQLLNGRPRVQREAVLEALDAKKAK